jgi:hypothetical protein
MVIHLTNALPDVALRIEPGPEMPTGLRPECADSARGSGSTSLTRCAEINPEQIADRNIPARGLHRGTLSPVGHERTAIQDHSRTR